MKIPNLNKRITIERRTYVSDGMGGSTFTSTSRGVWASFDQVSASETYRFASSESTSRFKVTIRYRTDAVFTNADTLTYSGRTFRILSTDQGDFDRNYVTLYVVEENTTQ
jgi:SPP1 family predicted phage head-tail adaptor